MIAKLLGRVALVVVVTVAMDQEVLVIRLQHHHRKVILEEMGFLLPPALGEVVVALALQGQMERGLHQTLVGQVEMEQHLLSQAAPL